MRNSLISVFLFIVLLISIYYLDSDFTSICNTVVVSCEKIEEHIKGNNMNEALVLADNLYEYIQSRGNIPAIYLNHMDYDSLTNEAIKLCIYIKNSNTSESLASVHILKFNALHLKELQKPTIENVF